MRRHAGRAAAATTLLGALLLLPAFAPSDVVTVVVRGTVTSQGGQPLYGANVLDGRSVSVGTDTAGRYQLSLRGERGSTVVLRARAVGRRPAQAPVTLDRDTIEVNFVLQEDFTRLDGVIVTGTAESSAPRSVPFSVSAVTASPAPGPAGRVAGAGIAASHRGNTEEYARIDENGFASVRANPVSTFSVDVDRASYSNVRRFVLTERRLPPKDAVRIEELINYFPYAYADPGSRHPIGVTADVGSAPWNPAHRLVRVAVQARRIPQEALPPSNLVFLLDVSGSMGEPNKLPLLQQSLRLLVQELRPVDRVAIVVYAGSAGLVLPATPAHQRERILDAIGALHAGGSTAGGEGIRLAYRVARESFIPGGNNRIVLATDGDFNVGVSSTAELSRLVEEKRKEGTFLTILGFGMGNLKDGRLERLAADGNGNYAYVDDLAEARKVLVHELGGTLVAVASDVKLQVEFNPARVRSYRLIGYENRMLAAEDFDDDAKDAGEVGAGHSVTALYEVVPVGAIADEGMREPPALRYQRDREAAGGTGAELLHVSVRYKRPGGSRSVLLKVPVRDVQARPSGELAFASAVAAYGMLLRESKHLGTASYEQVLELARGGLGEDPEGYRAGFVRLVEETARLSREVARRD